MDKREFWMEVTTNGLEDFIEKVPIILSREDIKECFEKALEYFRDREEIRKEVNYELP